MPVCLKIIFAATIALISAGCQGSSLAKAKDAGKDEAAGAAGRQAEASQQLIIKFKPATVACNVQAVLRFAAETKVRVEFLRTMSGNACVVVQHADSAANLALGRRTLKEHPAVEWLEPDDAMRIH